nr:uncharacterized protein LOC106622161 isoform X4 [Bactrocera oleae]
MGRAPNHKYCTAFLLVISIVCINADGTENTEIDMETFASHKLLVDSIFADSQNLIRYAFKRSVEVCQKLLNEEKYKNETSIESETYEMDLSNCVNWLLNPLIPSVTHRANYSDEIMLSTFGFEDVRKVVDKKYEEFFKDIVQRIDNYVKCLTSKQKRETKVKNLKRWSRRIKNAPTLEIKKIVFAKCIQFHYFEGGL